MVLTGLGLGIGVKVPHIAIQAVMETDNDIFIANGVASFFGQLGGTAIPTQWSLSALEAPISSALLVGGLRHKIPKIETEILAEDVINTGATGITSITRSPELIQKLRRAYCIAVSHAMIFLVRTIYISVPTAFGMKWLNIKKISMQREAKRREAADNFVLRQRSDAEKISV
ncbi:hypothetical protein ACMFMG_006315 [Clarireedia jacksonii]